MGILTQGYAPGWDIVAPLALRVVGCLELWSPWENVVAWTLRSPSARDPTPTGKERPEGIPDRGHPDYCRFEGEPIQGSFTAFRMTEVEGGVKVIVPGTCSSGMLGLV